MADTAFFAQHVKFEGLENRDLTAPKTPYILFGGSYAGAQVVRNNLCIDPSVLTDIMYKGIPSRRVP